MNDEGPFLDRKSLRKVTGRTADWKELAKDCVCFANAQGGSILIGIEDGADEPPKGQVVSCDLPGRIQKRLGELTVNVSVATEIKVASNGAQYIELRVLRAHSAASTTDGRYFVRISDDCKPLVGDDVLRLLEERNAQPWETLTSLGIAISQVDQVKLEISSADELKSWFGRLMKLDLVKSTGRTQAKRYFVPPELLDDTGLSIKTTLHRIEPHRLTGLVLEDIRRYPDTRIGEIHQRIGKEISRSMLKRTLAVLVKTDRIRMLGFRGGARYRLSD